MHKLTNAEIEFVHNCYAAQQAVKTLPPPPLLPLPLALPIPAGYSTWDGFSLSMFNVAAQDLDRAAYLVARLLPGPYAREFMDRLRLSLCLPIYAPVVVPVVASITASAGLTQAAHDKWADGLRTPQPQDAATLQAAADKLKRSQPAAGAPVTGDWSKLEAAASAASESYAEVESAQELIRKEQADAKTRMELMSKSFLDLKARVAKLEAKRKK